MPPDMERTVREYYAILCQRTKCEETPVATRSAGPVSHPGQYETYLHVKGTDDVVQNVIRVWASTFNTRSIIARARLGLPVEHDPIGVAVLTMVDAKAAGVMFSLNPTDGDETKVVLEGNWGLGEAVVSGSINPDRFLVDKILLQIEERIRRNNDHAASGGVDIRVGIEQIGIESKNGCGRAVLADLLGEERDVADVGGDDSDVAVLFASDRR